MKVDLFDYSLPEELIAALPAEHRDESRLLVLNRATGCVAHHRFRDLPELLRPGDVLVVNDARVLPARLRAVRDTGGAVELLLVRPAVDSSENAAPPWLAMVRAGGRLRPGEALTVDGTGLTLVLHEGRGEGYWVVGVGTPGATMDELMRAGSMPLPPYIVRSRRRMGMPDEMPDVDRERYQTVFAREPGAVAAPTAGLHFTPGVLDRIRAAGVDVHTLSLLVGPGTFQPVRTDLVEDHRLDSEFFSLPDGTAQAVATALREGRRVVATGTTTCRTLEHVARRGAWEEQSGWADIFIYPPFDFGAVGALITNFHLPRSTLLMLISAFAGRERILSAYAEAVRERYRFYSYGDAMLIV